MASTDERVVGAFVGDTLAGAAGLSRETRERTRHKALLFGMYVPQTHRRLGLGRALVKAVLAEAAAWPGLRVVQLTVTDGNAAAQSLYESCGFRVFGVEPVALCIDGRELAKVHMWLRVSEHLSQTRRFSDSCYNRRRDDDDAVTKPLGQGDVPQAGRPCLEQTSPLDHQSAALPLLIVGEHPES